MNSICPMICFRSTDTTDTTIIMETRLKKESSDEIHEFHILESSVD